MSEAMNGQIPTYAYCHRSGQIGFGDDTPKGALLICALDKDKRDRIIARARLSREDNETMFVPGIPEAANEAAALDALIAFIDWIVLDVPPARAGKAVGA